MSNIDFNQLSFDSAKNAVSSCFMHKQWHRLYKNPQLCTDMHTLTAHIQHSDWQDYRHRWQSLCHDSNEHEMTSWLISLFNAIFTHPNFDATPTQLVRGNGEPEYFASKASLPARIEFAHGFFQSALHEISHWCIAGKRRRQLDDFGYWYIRDGRDALSQERFEQVEIKPQAIECLFSLALSRYFYVSQDNLEANFDTSKSTFAADVFHQAKLFLENPHHLPRDAKRLIWLFLSMNENFYANTLYSPSESTTEIA